MQITETAFGQYDGQEITAITLQNEQGVSLTAINYGATVIAWHVPDKEGRFQNIVLGFDRLEDYLQHHTYYGATVGRVAGRIGKGRFSLDGQDYQLEANQNGNHLHGGTLGLDQAVWDYEIREGETEASILFRHVDLDGSNGYPGRLEAEVVYTLTEDQEWRVEYHARTDRPTLFNPTNHTYFNLSQEAGQDVLQHLLLVDSSRVPELDKTMLPTGQFLDVAGTPFDFRRPARIQQAAALDHPQTQLAGGLDHPFLLEHSGDFDVVLAYPEAGRSIRMHTDRDAVVIFTHNGGTDEYLLGGKPVPAYAGIALETQSLPDAINQEGFGNIVLRPDEEFYARTVYQFQLLD